MEIDSRVAPEHRKGNEFLKLVGLCCHLEASREILIDLPGFDFFFISLIINKIILPQINSDNN